MKYFKLGEIAPCRSSARWRSRDMASTNLSAAAFFNDDNPRNTNKILWTTRIVNS